VSLLNSDDVIEGTNLIAANCDWEKIVTLEQELRPANRGRKARSMEERR
jgi:hypothetical protein